MSGNTVIRRLRKPALALGACVGFGVLAPMYLAERASDNSFAGSAVLASPRDLYVITVPVRLSSAPDLTLNRAVIYDYGQSVPPGGVSQVVLDGPVLSLNAAGLGATEGPGGIEAEPVPPLIQQIGALGFDVVAIRRGTLHVVMGDGDVETLTDIQAEVKKNRRGQIASQGSFTVRGQRLAFDTTFGQPDKTQPQRWPLQVSFKASLLQGTFDGHADLSEGLQLVGQTELAITSLRRVGRWFGLPLYVTEGFNATTVKGDLTWARRSLAFEKARIAVDGNEGNGRLALNLAGDRPLLEATLDFTNLNLTPYLDAARTQLFGFELPVTWGASFDVSLPMIRYLDADMRISANRIALKDLGFGQGGATVTAQAGKLRADIAEVELPSGGTLSAQVTAIMTEAVPRYAVRAKVESLEMGPATARLLGSPALTGRAGLTFDLTSTGYYAVRADAASLGQGRAIDARGRAAGARPPSRAPGGQGGPARLGGAGPVPYQRRAARGALPHHRRCRLRRGHPGPRRRPGAGSGGSAWLGGRQHGRPPRAQAWRSLRCVSEAGRRQCERGRHPARPLAGPDVARRGQRRHGAAGALRGWAASTVAKAGGFVRP